MPLSALSEAVVSMLLILGGLFLFVGSYALVKLRDTMQRLHGPTKATTLGLGGILGASMLYFWLAQDAPSIHEVLIALFLFLTAPISAHMIAKAHMHLVRQRRLALHDEEGRAEAAQRPTTMGW